MSKESLRKQILELVEKYADYPVDQKYFEEGMTPIPPSGKVIGSKELSMMTDSVLDGWLTTGRFNEKFQEVLAHYRKVPDKDQKSQYSIADHSDYLQGDMLDLFNLLRNRLLNLDPMVREEYKKLYVAYKTSTNFVDIEPQKVRLRLTLNLRFDEINDPKELCKNVANLGRWGNGDVEVGLDSEDRMDDIMYLVQQSFEKHSEDIG